MTPTEARQKLQELEMRIIHLQDRKYDAVMELDYDKAVQLRDEAYQIRLESFKIIVEYL